VRRVRVKICGITREEDARLAVRLGADALGFVLWPASPRAVSLADARTIAAAVPALVTRVGVFVNERPEAVAAAVRAVGLDAVQLHGDEVVEAYAAVPARIIKAVRVAAAADLERAVALPASVTPLVDVSDRDTWGGTGRTADWTLARGLSARRPILLAGGLNPDNVAAALNTVAPWGVDVSSGVEAAPGVKSRQRLEQFFTAVAAAHGR
jgi:phosphoribosylanthranilate isomerase